MNDEKSGAVVLSIVIEAMKSAIQELSYRERQDFVNQVGQFANRFLLDADNPQGLSDAEQSLLRGVLSDLERHCR